MQKPSLVVASLAAVARGTTLFDCYIMVLHRPLGSGITIIPPTNGRGGGSGGGGGGGPSGASPGEFPDGASPFLFLLFALGITAAVVPATIYARFYTLERREGRPMTLEELRGRKLWWVLAPP